MTHQTISRIRDWGEPAHPAVIKLHQDLVRIYSLLREKQTHIDDAFDQASREIGFVVTTTLPAQLAIQDNQISEISLAGEHLQGTIFENSFGKLLESLKGKKLEASSGKFHFYLIWLEALKLKFRTDWKEPAHLQPGRLLKTHWMEPAHPAHWMEPAHVLREINPRWDESIAKVLWEAHEPAHWFDRGALIGMSEAVVIEAIDAVYPELQLIERINRYRRGAQVELNPQPLPPRETMEID